MLSARTHVLDEQVQSEGQTRDVVAPPEEEIKEVHAETPIVEPPPAPRPVEPVSGRFEAKKRGTEKGGPPPRGRSKKNRRQPRTPGNLRPKRLQLRRRHPRHAGPAKPALTDCGADHYADGQSGHCTSSAA